MCILEIGEYGAKVCGEVSAQKEKGKKNLREVGTKQSAYR